MGSMMVKMAATLVVAATVMGFLGGQTTTNIPPPKLVVRLAPLEWKDIRRKMDQDGFCLIESANVYLTITNHVEHWFPHGNPRLKEPTKYPGQ